MNYNLYNKDCRKRNTICIKQFVLIQTVESLVIHVWEKLSVYYENIRRNIASNILENKIKKFKSNFQIL